MISCKGISIKSVDRQTALPKQRHTENSVYATGGLPVVNSILNGQIATGRLFLLHVPVYIWRGTRRGDCSNRSPWRPEVARRRCPGAPRTGPTGSRALGPSRPRA